MTFFTKILPLITCSFLTMYSQENNPKVYIYDIEWNKIIKSGNVFSIIVQDMLRKLENDTKNLKPIRITETEDDNNSSFKFSIFVPNQDQKEEESDLFTIQFQKNQNGVITATFTSPLTKVTATGYVNEVLSNPRSLTASLELQNLPDPDSVSLQSLVQKLQ